MLYMMKTKKSASSEVSRAAYRSPKGILQKVCPDLHYLRLLCIGVISITIL